jgi:esterase
MKLAFREFGSGQPLIILHGLFGQSDNWNTHAKHFSEKGFHVFALDQRNHGLSPHSKVWTYEAMADDLKEFIDDHQLKDPILLGHSMGGKTVLFFELKYSGIASKIIIADISARAYPAHHQEVLTALNEVDFAKITTRKEAEAILNTHITDFGTKQFLLKNIYWKDSASNLMDWRFNLEVITNSYDNVCVGVPEFVSEVKTLFIKGETSNYINDSDREDLKKRFPHSTLVTLNGAGHWVHAEKPKEFFETALQFITS